MTNPVLLTKGKMAAANTQATAVQPLPDGRMQLFTQLKPYTSQLLRARDLPARLQGLLRSLQSVIRDADVDALNSRGIFDYILFPLMPGVDSIVLLRRPGDKTASSNLPYPAAQSDAVAEAMLECCVLLLQRCPVQSGEQLSELLERFGTVASLGKASAAEEVRLKAIRCMLAMLSVSSGSPHSPSVALRDPSRAPMLGFLFSILLKAAEEEVQAGLTGSQALAAAALETVQYLSQAVDSGDALAFVVPGLASGLSKILIAAGSSSRQPSGSRVGSATAVEALKAFTCLVTATLGDAHAHQLAVGEQAQVELSAEEAFGALQKLALQRQEPAADPIEDIAGAQQRPAPGRSMRCKRTKAWIQTTRLRLTGLIDQALPPLTAHPRTAVRVTLAQGVTTLLEGCSPVLEGASEVLYEVLFTLAQDDWPHVSSHCQAWLTSCLPQHPQAGKAVPGIVQRLLLGLLPALRSGEEAATLHARRLTTALQASCHSLFAPQPESACSQQQLTTLLLNSPVSAASWAPTLCRCFAFERSAAALLMYNTSQAGPHTAMARPQLTPSTSPQHPSSNNPPHAPHHTALGPDPCEPRQSVSDAAASSLPPEPVARECSKTSAADPVGRIQAGRTQAGRTYPSKQASAATEASDDSGGQFELATVVLPRMPLGLKHITTSTAFTAMANVARALGRCSMAAGRESPTHSDSAVLHGITQDLLDMFQAEVPAQAANGQPPPGRPTSSSQPEQDPTANPGWQGKAASAVVALTEVVFGASASWQGTQQQQQRQQQQQQQQQQQPKPDSSQHSHNSTAEATAATTPEVLLPAAAACCDITPQHTRPSSDSAQPSLAPTAQHGSHSLKNSREACDVCDESASSAAKAPVHMDSGVLELIVVQALAGFSDAGVWSLATHLDADAAGPGNDHLTPQVLGENAVLIRAMLEAVGVFARVLGPRFVSSGVILRKVLLLLLERLGDPCPSVASSAAAALGVLCLHCGYPSRRALLAENADYLVDGLCRQLRSLDSHPRAPHLFAAVLQQAGAGQQLLPLLADPARAAFQGLSITARHNRAFHTHPFLQVLMHIVAMCEAEAAALLAATQETADDIKAALAAIQPQSQDCEEGESEGSAGASRIDAVRAYFEAHHRKKAIAGDDDAAVGDTAFDAGITVLEEVSGRRSLIHSVAVLAHAAAEVATPLLLSANLKVGLLALKVGHGALRALHSTTAALDLYEQVISPVTSKQEGVRPPPPDTPQLLPSIHVLWGALVGVLKDGRRALVQGALQCLVGVCQLGGVQFLTRRIQTEAWPILLHLMTHGVPEQTRAVYPAGHGSQTAPTALQQMRYCVLQCIGQLTSIGTSRTVWKGMTDKVAEATALYLDSAQTCAVKEAAAQASAA
ncbi:hypothetical protein ABBQ32_003877 [Trebouxia sp. C0010 RCD-2024]